MRTKERVRKKGREETEKNSFLFFQHISLREERIWTKKSKQYAFYRIKRREERKKMWS
jgi:hypothetical protein